MGARCLDIGNPLAGKTSDLALVARHDGSRTLLDQPDDPDITAGGGHDGRHVADQSGLQPGVGEQAKHVGAAQEGMSLQRISQRSELVGKNAVPGDHRTQDPGWVTQGLNAQIERWRIGSQPVELIVGLARRPGGQVRHQRGERNQQSRYPEPENGHVWMFRK